MLRQGVLKVSKVSQYQQTDSYYVEVAALTEVSSDTVVPNGETWEVMLFDGSAAYLDDTTVSIVWDYGGAGETILAATHGDVQDRTIVEQVTGDGVKKLSIVLTNDTSAARVLGAHWEAQKV